MSFGERLQAVRRGSGLTQEEFARQLKVSRQAVSKWESSRGYPELEKIIYICNRYGVPMGELFQDEVPLAPQPRAQEADRSAPLESQPLKKALGNFFSNLSPGNQFYFAAALAVALAALLALSCIFTAKGGTDLMIEKLVWTALLILFAAGEAISVGLTSIWFAAGALIALIAALLGGPLWLQITLFIAVSALCLTAVRPLARRYVNSRIQPTNADRIIGAQARVTEDIDNLRAVGSVQVGGLTWSARSAGGDPISAGTLVRILRIEGVKVYVEEVKKEEAVCQQS